MTILQILATQAPDGDISSTNAIVIHHKISLLSHPSVEYNSGLKRSHSVAANESTYFFQLLEQFVVSKCLDLTLTYGFTVAAGVAVIYDWALTLGQEIELIWRQRWSLMSVLYLLIRYIGLPYSVTYILQNMPMVTLTDAGSRMMLIFLVIVFLAVNIASGVISSIDVKQTLGEFILFGTHTCSFGFGIDARLLFSMLWMLNTVWEVLALCLSIWVSVKHFRDLRRLGPSTGSTIGDCFTVLIKSHVLYFASFVGLSCLQFARVSLEFLNPNFIGSQMLNGALQILLFVQMFVMGPRLILSVREYHANLVAGSDAENSMNSIIFQEHVRVSTSSTV
ncbi:uncharacterized protein HD556DRAFT_1531898 [Suillus plorans]|uniref:DUF6533 domain-containing protein n=1 Tax=Suillus plorans TaxID=116603 RepID=A0A9P7DA66_9AGAM|nr:uncharacterized protein HD556DRAFT_1531898 [Suillus plorans]KAG1784713.1 hypothetical protein HD556DRAFT_1531898 [Suillus plorans]